MGDLTVVANLGDARMRARLAKGTLNALGAHEILVAAGSDGGRANETLHDYEFEACPYLAPDDVSLPLPRTRTLTLPPTPTSTPAPISPPVSPLGARPSGGSRALAGGDRAESQPG